MAPGEVCNYPGFCLLAWGEVEKSSFSYPDSHFHEMTQFLTY
jgi:hypothetical protein